MAFASEPRVPQQMEIELTTRPSRSRFLIALAAIPLALSACTAAATQAPTITIPGVPQKLVDDARAEGNLTTIALPHSWCDYGDMLKDFTAKYGITINELNPDGGSKDEITAIKANKGNTGPAAPDVIDVGLSFGPQAKTAGDSSPTRSRPGTTSRTRPRMPTATGTATTTASSPSRSTRRSPTVPQDWNDLLKPEYKKQVALAGDPTVLEPGHLGRLGGRHRHRRLARQRRSRASTSSRSSTTPATSCRSSARRRRGSG